MKCPTTILLLFISFHLLAQNNIEGYKPVASVLYYVDSIKIDMNKTIINVGHVLNINVISDINKQSHNDGSVYITMQKGFRLISLNQLFKERAIKSSAYLISIDGKLMNDTSMIRIDPTYIQQVQLIPGKEISYLSRSFRKLSFIEISLKTKKEEDIIHLK